MKNSGTKLKTIAKVMFVVSVVGAGLLAIVYGFAVGLGVLTEIDVAAAAIIAGLATAVITGGLCALIAWIYFCVLDALADAAKNTFVLLKRLKELDAKVSALQTADASAPQAEPPGNENLT